ncbi:NUDIX domain-containing protein [Kitasatospora sp. NPDC004240]
MSEYDDRTAPHDPPEFGPRRFLAGHAAPAACADAVVRDEEGRLLIVDPLHGEGWDLPGGMLEDELPDAGLRHALEESLGLRVRVGRLLVFDAVPADRWGRSVLSFVFAAHCEDPAGTAAPLPRGGAVRAARFVTDEEASELLAPPVAARLRAATGAERGSHTVLLRDGEPVPGSRRDHYWQLSGPLIAATVLVRDTAGRVLVLEPSYKDHLELPGGMVEPNETPAQAAARELEEELGLRLPVGRLLVLDSIPAALSRSGRAMTCHVFDLAPLTARQSGSLVFADGEVRSARWLAPEQAIAELPPVLSDRVSAALRALAGGGVEILDRDTAAPPTEPGSQRSA